MSLEAKIDQLTQAVNTLTKAILDCHTSELAQAIVSSTPINAEQVQQVVEQVKAEQVATVEEVPAQTVEIDPEEIKAMCLTIVRKDASKKQAIVKLLGKYGAKTVNQVPTDKLAELKATLEAGV